MTRKPYNPYLKTLVDNCRSDLKRQSIDASSYTDSDLYDVIHYWYGCEDDNGNDMQETGIIEDVTNNVRRPQ